MPRPEHFGRWRLAAGAVVFLGLALMMVQPRASAPLKQQMRALAALPVAAQSMPTALDCTLPDHLALLASSVGPLLLDWCPNLCLVEPYQWGTGYSAAATVRSR